MSTYFFHSKRSRSHSRFFYLILCTVLVCPMLLFTGCQNTTGTSTATEKEPISISSIKLNTAIQITIYDSQDKSLLDDCLALCDRYELIFSRTNENSELYKLNHRISDSAVSNQTIETQTTPYQVNGTTNTWHISEYLAALLSEGLDITRESDGAFDIAIAPLTSLWDFTAEDPKVPDDADAILINTPTVDYSEEEAQKIIDKRGLYPITVIQPQYNMVDRYIEHEIMGTCRKYGIGITSFSPLSQGLLTGKYKKGQPYPEGSRATHQADKQINNLLTDENLAIVDELSKVADDLGTNVAILSLAWILKHPEISCVIAGASKPSQLENNLKAVDLEIPDDAMERIEKILGFQRFERHVG